MHLVGDREGLLPRVQRRLPGVEATEVEAHMATYCLFATNHQRQLAYSDSTISITTVKRSRFRTVRAMPKRHL